jgi:hypothetical protein
MAVDPDMDADDQDQAETFDETHITEDGEDIARPDVMRNVFDVTSAEDDADDGDLEDQDPDDFDPDALDETEREVLLEEDDGVDDDDGPITRDQGDVVAEDDDSPATYQGVDLEDADPDEAETASARGRSSARRDAELDDTFPASDSLPASPGSD